MRMLRRKEPAPTLRQYSTSILRFAGGGSGSCTYTGSPPPSSIVPTSCATEGRGTADDGAGATTCTVPVPPVGVNDCTCTVGLGMLGAAGAGMLGGGGSLSFEGSDGSMASGRSKNRLS